MKKRMNERKREWMKGKRINELKKNIMNENEKEWMNERVKKEWMNERETEWKREWREEIGWKEKKEKEPKFK